MSANDRFNIWIIISKYLYYIKDPTSAQFGMWYARKEYAGRDPQWVLDDINMDIFKAGIQKRLTLEDFDTVLKDIWFEWFNSKRAPSEVYLAFKR